MQQRRQHKRSAAHIKALDQAEERTFKGVVEASPSPTAAVSPAPEPSPPPSVVDSVSASPSPPGSPKVCCSQYRQAQQDEEMAAAEEGEASGQEVPPPARAAAARSWPAIIEHAPDYKGNIFRYGDEQLHVRKDHRNEKGQAPLCYVDTGYRGRPAPDGCEHQAYMVYNGADLVWARRLQFHLRRFQA